MDVDSLERSVFKTLVQLDDKRQYLVSWNDLLKVIDLHSLHLNDKASRNIFRKCKVDGNFINFTGLRNDRREPNISFQVIFPKSTLKTPSKTNITQVSKIISQQPQHEGIFKHITFLRNLFTCYQVGIYNKMDLINTLELIGLKISETLTRSLQKNEFGLTFQDFMIGLVDIDPKALDNTALLQLNYTKRKTMGLKAVRSFDEGNINFKTLKNKLIQLGLVSHKIKQLLTRSEQTGKASFSLYCRLFTEEDSLDSILEEAWEDTEKTDLKHIISEQPSNQQPKDVEEIDDHSLEPNNLLLVLKRTTILDDFKTQQPIVQQDGISAKDQYHRNLETNWSF